MAWRMDFVAAWRRIFHQLGVADKTIQRILRRANVAVTQNCYLKTADSEVAAAMEQ